MSPAAAFRASVVITTRNRRDELRAAIASALAQTARPEVLVIDDGSTDGTSEMVRSEFPAPAVRLERRDRSAGLIARRNEAARLAAAPVVVSIDDDAAFPSPRTVEQTLAEFGHPRVAAVAIPFVNVRQADRHVHQRAGAPGIQVCDRFIGTAHALRRDVFLTLGGYREHLIHQGEEGDFCIRLLAAGYVVRLGTADPIDHFESPRRDFRRMDYYGRRNDVLFAFHNVPMPEAVAHALGTTVNGLVHGIRRGRPVRMAYGLAAGWAATARYRRDRLPVPRAVYRLSRRLKRGGPLPLERIEGELPAMAPPPAVT